MDDEETIIKHVEEMVDSPEEAQQYLFELKRMVDECPPTTYQEKWELGILYRELKKHARR